MATPLALRAYKTSVGLPHSRLPTPRTSSHSHIHLLSSSSRPPSTRLLLSALPDTATTMGAMHQKIWLVTGTSSGFGKRLVLSILARGDCVIATARNLEKLRATFPAAERSRLCLLQLDVSDSAEVVQQRMKEALSLWGRIDVVVNNAGYGVKAVLEEGG
ncbi:hypothetical protein NUW54_g14251 [Trametes sanguinea]|uniref:Uncharacterized protein n=1 Tax=Trametes sanguinea TaxID=158606 RepID=A0ACC1MDG3_9APHY|nr:hypothetical protein NUW54_g14251 [Trametes sanguinea]